MKVADILRVKGSTLFTVTPQASLWSAVQTMAENDIGSVVVMDRGEVVGMLTFREVLGRVHDNGGAVGDGSVGAAMAAPRIVSPDADVMDLRRMLLEEHTRYLPVVDGRTLMGVVSFYDVAKAVLEEQSYENRMLKAYIRDWPEQEQVGN
ncbi:MAG: CBS domain-containing protein [Burkholderiales bacterium]|jgi:CBS domain-containing protein|nr:MAG: CBS domain-containing protein [Burkholderiales bacterium]